MDALEAIRTRRSIRKYEGRPVPEDLVERLLAAAASAPSAERPAVAVHHRRPAAAAGGDCADQPQRAHGRPRPFGHPDMRRFEPGTLAGLLGRRLRGGDGERAFGRSRPRIGAVWTGIYPRPERMEGFRKLFGLPQGVIAHSLVVLGFPAEAPPPVNRFRPDRVRRNRW